MYIRFSRFFISREYEIRMYLRCSEEWIKWIKPTNSEAKWSRKRGLVKRSDRNRENSE